MQPVQSQGLLVRSARRLHLLVGLLLILVLGGVRLDDPLPVQEMRAQYFDQLQRLSPRAAGDLPVRVVDIDDASLALLGQWPWPRDRMAEMVERLNAYGAAAIAFDVLFAEPDRMSPANLARDPQIARILGEGAGALPDHDELFAAAMQDRRVVLGTADLPAGGASVTTRLPGVVEVGLNPSAGLPMTQALTPVFPILAEASAGIGSVSASPTATPRVIRSVPLMWRTGDGVLPTLALEALRVAFGESTYVLMGAQGEAGLVEAVRIGPFDIPTTAAGELLLYYRWDDPRLYVPAHELLAEFPSESMAAAFEGSIVLIGTSAAGLLDIRTTALGEAVPGVSIHAQLLEQVLGGEFLHRPALLDAIELLGFLAVGGFLIATMATAGPVASLLAGGLAALLVVAASLYGFLVDRMLIDATFPLIGGLILFITMLVLRFLFVDRERRQIRRSFSQYVSRDVLDVIERADHRLELGGDLQTVTVMFADIRDFTALSETMSPTAMVSLLNELFTDLGDAILAEQGTIDKFIGDATMAFWNAPVQVPDHRARACRAALGMRAALEAFNDRRFGGGAAPVALAIGLSSGPACVGNIGSSSRFNYSVIGDTVNAAARIESACRHVAYDILVSADVAAEADDLALLPAGALALKGKAGRLPTFILVGDAEVAAGAAFRTLAPAHDALIAALVSEDALREEQFGPCIALARDVAPGLEAFYQRLRSRVDDLRSLPPDFVAR